ncbi:MAG: sigma factor [Rhodanobacteraceae bacterium]
MENTWFGEYDAATVAYVEGRAAQKAAAFGIQGSDVDDVVQEALLKLRENVEKQRKKGPIKDEWNFIRSRAKQRIVDQLRKGTTQKAKLVQCWSRLPCDADQPDNVAPNSIVRPKKQVNQEDPAHLELVERVREVLWRLPFRLERLCTALLMENMTEERMARRLFTSRTQVRRMIERLQRIFLLAGFEDFQKRVVQNAPTASVMEVTAEGFSTAAIPTERRSPARPQPRVMVKNASRSSNRTPATVVSANY